MTRVTALFDNQAQAEAAVMELRQIGVADAHLSFVSRHNDGVNAGGAGAAGGNDGDDAGSGAMKGLLGGAGVGALFGIAASLIPGVGPFITAGWLASALGSAVAGGAAAGAIVGGTSGLVAGALAKAGYDEHEASYYGSGIEQGGVLVAVDTSTGLGAEQVSTILTRHGGRTYTAA